MADILYGTTVPSDGDGSDGDLYIRTTNGAMYLKDSGTWGSPFFTPVNITNGRKWSEVATTSSLNDADYFMVVQAGVNKTITKANTKTQLAGAKTLFAYTTTVESVDGTETDLYTDSIAANTLAANKDRICFEYHGNVVNGLGLTEVIKIYFAGTEIFDSAAFVTQAISFHVTGTIIRVSSTVVRCSVLLELDDDTTAVGSTSAIVELTGLNLATGNILKITGQGTTTGDVAAKLGAVTYFPAP